MIELGLLFGFGALFYIAGFISGYSWSESKAEDLLLPAQKHLEELQSLVSSDTRVVHVPKHVSRL